MVSTINGVKILKIIKVGLWEKNIIQNIYDIFIKGCK